MPELHAEHQLQSAEVATVPHMRDRDRKSLLRNWRKALPRARTRKATSTDLAGIGIAIEEAPRG